MQDQLFMYIFSLNDSIENVEIALNLFKYIQEVIIIYESKYQSILRKALDRNEWEPIDDRPAVIIYRSATDPCPYIVE